MLNGQNSEWSKFQIVKIPNYENFWRLRKDTEKQIFRNIAPKESEQVKILRNQYPDWIFFKIQYFETAY